MVDPRHKSSHPPPVSIIEINGRGTTTRTVQTSSQVQKKLTPPSIYPSIHKSREITDRLGLEKTTQVMKNLELTSGLVGDEAMAPQDMTVEPPVMDVDSDDVVSISSQPESHKRPMSPVADDQREAKKPRLDRADDVEGLDLFGDHEAQEVVAEPFSEPPTYEDTLIPVPKTAFPHFGDGINVVDMCLQKDIIYIQPTLDKHAQTKGQGVLFKPCGHYDVIKSDEKWFIPLGYCMVDQGYRLEAHWGDVPRVQAPKKYQWLKDKNDVWQKVWKTWEGTMLYTDDAYRQECDESSIMGSAD